MPAESITPTPPALPGFPLFNFTAGEPGWGTVDDVVMGGISRSNVQADPTGGLRFAGVMSLENNGGFASVRSQWSPMDLSQADGVLLRVLGDGKSYRLRIRSAAAGADIAYNARFDTARETWQLVYVPFASMVPTFRGLVMDVGALDPATIGSFGFMLSDGQPGPFALQVAWIRAVTEAELSALAP